MGFTYIDGFSMADSVRYSLGVDGFMVVDGEMCVVECSIKLVDGFSTVDETLDDNIYSYKIC